MMLAAASFEVFCGTREYELMPGAKVALRPCCEPFGTGFLANAADNLRASGSSCTGLMIVSALRSFCSTSGSMGMLICSMCFAR